MKGIRPQASPAQWSASCTPPWHAAEYWIPSWLACSEMQKFHFCISLAALRQ